MRREIDVQYSELGDDMHITLILNKIRFEH